MCQKVYYGFVQEFLVTLMLKTATIAKLPERYKPTLTDEIPKKIIQNYQKLVFLYKI
jgi:hypothetical protein